MKAHISASTAFSCLLFITIFLSACQKEKVQPVSVEPGATLTSQRPQAIAKTNNLVLKTFTHDARTYSFYYAPNGRVDSVIVTGDEEYAYRAAYKGNHLDSVVLIHDGLIESVNRNFQYKGDLIVGFDYFLRIYNSIYPWNLSVTYDDQKRIVSIDRSYQGKVESHNVWTYNDRDDVVNILGLYGGDGSFTYDNKLNPLHFVPNLFVLFVEEPYIWEYTFSLHNSISKTISGGRTKTYVNQYNDAGQLTRKTLIDYRNVTFFFTYQ